MSRPALLPVALLVVVLTAGCLGLGGEPPVREDRAVDVLESATDRTQQVETYRFDLSLFGETSQDGRLVEASGQGRVNVTARTLAANTTANGHTAAAYIDNDTAYEQCARPGSFWGERRVTAENWTAGTPLGRHLVLLSSGDLYYNGTERVDGSELIHLSGRPSLEAIEETSGAGTTDLPSGAAVDRLTLDAWIDAETHRLRRSRMVISVSRDDRRATVRLRAEFHSYGEPVSVSVPADARDAFFDDGCPES